MQPVNSLEVLVAGKHLQYTDEWLFDHSPSSPHLMHVFLNSRYNFDHHRYYYSFVAKIAYAHWAISRLHKYVSRVLFTDCTIEVSLKKF